MLTLRGQEREGRCLSSEPPKDFAKGQRTVLTQDRGFFTHHGSCSQPLPLIKPSVSQPSSTFRLPLPAEPGLCPPGLGTRKGRLQGSPGRRALDGIPGSSLSPYDSVCQTSVVAARAKLIHLRCGLEVSPRDLPEPQHPRAAGMRTPDSSRVLWTLLDFGGPCSHGRRAPCPEDDCCVCHGLCTCLSPPPFSLLPS